MTPRRLRPPWPGLIRYQQRKTPARRAEVLELFRHLPDPEGALAATEWVVADHARRVGAIFGLQGLSERPEVFDPRWRREYEGTFTDAPQGDDQ